MQKKFLSLTIATALFGFGGIAHAETLAEEMATPLGSMKDGARVTLTGTVKNVGVDEFDLNYGSIDDITVELDRFGWSGNEAQYLIPGESVTVSGYIDDDLFEGREIEAYNLRLNDSYVYYYTTDVDPIYYYDFDDDYTLDDTMVTMTGLVSNIEGKEFTLTNANGSMKVDVDELEYDPFDDEGIQKIVNGDRVYVYGEIDNDFFEQREIEADGIVELIGRQ